MGAAMVAWAWAWAVAVATAKEVVAVMVAWVWAWVAVVATEKEDMIHRMILEVQRMEAVVARARACMIHHMDARARDGRGEVFVASLPCGDGGGARTCWQT